MKNEWMVVTLIEPHQQAFPLRVSPSANWSFPLIFSYIMIQRISYFSSLTMIPVYSSFSFFNCPSNLIFLFHSSQLPLRILSSSEKFSSILSINIFLVSGLPCCKNIIDTVVFLVSCSSLSHEELASFSQIYLASSQFYSIHLEKCC